MLEKTLEGPLDSKEIKPVNPKGNQSWIIIHWKNWCWSSNTLATQMPRAESLEKTDAGKDWKQKKRAALDETVRQHHWLSGHEFEQTLGDIEE